MSEAIPSDYLPPPIPARIRQASRDRGLVAVLGACLGWGIRYLLGLSRTRTREYSSFECDGQSYQPFAHRYHYTWLNERAVEVPIVRRAMETAGNARVLEIGNVLSHYFPPSHAVVDKYEQAPGVRNVDVLDLPADGSWNLIVAISTLEHVGLDEFPQDPDRAVAAIAHLRGVLAPGGRLLATIPVGQNPTLDAAIRGGRAGFDRVLAMRRVTASNRWEQVALPRVWGSPYDFLLHTAHGLLICELRREHATRDASASA